MCTTLLEQLAEMQDVPIYAPGDAQERRKTTRRTYDGLTPYRSTFAPDFWKLHPGSSRCVCWACNDGFNSVKAFDKHQVINSNGDTICRDPATLGMVRNATGWWITEARDMESKL